MSEFAEAVARDPWTHLLAHVYAEAWADGFEKARASLQRPLSVEHGRTVEVASHAELRERALQELDDRNREGAKRMLLALAAVAPHIVRTEP